ncbi:alpha-2-macroglobulin-like [Engystomops pustulosus]|uniref:alpha-2-macroglobulin-like n=1 Tax=Engystomops pustulosus TaxID=76066 RepID=UPI003AFAE56E
MWLLWVSACLAIFGTSLTSASKPYFVITTPTNILQGTTEKACVTFLDLKAEVQLKIELKHEDHVVPVTEQKINTHDLTQCFSFQVPTVKERQSEWQLHVAIHGEDLNVDESKTVLIFKTDDACIIQTDKSTYKPGETVKFRLLTMNFDLQAISQKYPLIEITNSNGNRVAQWLDVSTTDGFADFSFHLASEAVIGGYKINIDQKCHKNFQVYEYVRKRFEFNLKLPSDVALADESFHLEACGSYIYGKPVEGKIDLSLCKETFHYTTYHEEDHDSNEPAKKNCVDIKGEKTDSKGCVSRDIKLADFHFDPTDPNEYLMIRSELTEDGTGHSETETSILGIKQPRKYIEFVERHHVYYKGFPFKGTVKVTNERNKPIANEAVTLYIPINKLETGEVDHVIRVNLVSDSNGIAAFSLDTSEWQQHMVVKVGFTSNDKGETEGETEFETQGESQVENLTIGYPQDYTEDQIWLSVFYSKSKSRVSIKKDSEDLSCNSDLSVTVNYDIEKSILDPDTDHIHFFYIILTKSGIFTYKSHEIDIKDKADTPDLHGSFQINFHVDPDCVPEFNFLVFTVLPNGEILASATDYNVAPCVQNKVKLSFSAEQVRPGEDVNLEVTAEAGSLCSVRSVDKGYLIERPHDDMSLLLDATNLLRYTIRKATHTYQSTEPVVHDCPDDTLVEVDHIPDVYKLFRMNNLQIITNTEIKPPVKCVKPHISGRSYIKKKTKAEATEKKTRKDYTRSYFPDRWLYDLVPVGSDGHTVINRTTPHTITKWVTDAFCLGKTGFGSVSNVELTTFQPYFVDLIVPYSVVQGEQFKVQAVVFSYVEKCILIVISISDSDNLITDKDEEQARCVCEGHSHTFSWDVSALNPKTLKIHVVSGSIELAGECTENVLLVDKEHRKDSVEKTVVVKPKGYEDEKTETFLIFPSEDTDEFAIKIETPERLVEGSERAHIIVMGDIVANMAINLEDMIYLPDGCGEQNAAKMVRYTRTMEYLKTIEELTPEQKAKIIEALNEGYQKQLTYRTENGSYVFFPGSSENIWLTAFVVKAFSGAQKYIFIDENQIQKAVTWMQTYQKPDGCFKDGGDFFNNHLETDHDVARTAYITLALLEHRIVLNGTIVEDALSCLRKSVDVDESLSTQALLAYVFTLSGDHELRDKLLKKLDEKVKTEDGAKHWGTSWYLQSETASYVVLALLSKEITTKEDLAYCGDIIRWLVKHQNPWGGFHSSQDTTLALEAVTKYAKAINHRKGDATVTITSKSGFKKVIHVDKSNSLLLQTVGLPEIPGVYTVIATGAGYVYLQSHVHYHAKPKVTGKEPFSFNVTTEPSACTHASQKHFDVHIDVSYTGKREHTNMALIMLDTVSGYVADKESVNKLKKNPLVRRTEVTPQNISIYLEKITHEPISLVFALEKEAHVENLQPVHAAVLDYYDPDDFTVVSYSAPCTSFVAHCAVAGAEREDCGHSEITKEQCEEKGCCYDSSVAEIKWCFFHGFKQTENQKSSYQTIDHMIKE